ncbi:uncharacterized protein [Anabrus simplex]|uniref:uncharacterized protein n=1 Tax=Anabrus simplex TaxID=316456 RepID=UPI0035A35F59
MSFTAEMDEELIEEVRMHPVLYNLQHKSYKNNVVKDNLWKMISLKLDRTENECKTRWRSIRDTYRKIKIKGKYKTGSAAPSKSKYNTAKFAFLDVALQERKTVSSLPEKTANEHESHDSDAEESEKRKEELGTGTEDNEEKEELNFHEERTRSGEADSHGNPSYKKRKAIFLKDRALDEIKKGRESRMAIMKQILAIKSEGHKEDHPVIDFFKSMAKTVMEFSPELIAETRMKVCQIVTEMEMRHLYQQRTTSSTTFSTPNSFEDSNSVITELSPGTSSVQDEVSTELSQYIALP